MEVETIRSFADKIDRSPQFVRAAIRLKKIEAEKVGHMWIIPRQQIGLFKKSPFQITQKEMLS